jgi:hypothetical protein
MHRVLAALLAILAASLVRADEPATPPNYAAAFCGTTVAYRPPGGPLDGLPHDLTVLAGYGRYVSKTVALELDLGPTWVKGRYASFSLVPGVVWTINPYAYAAARFVVPVDPEARFVLFPGLGLSRTFGRTTPILEVNLSSTVGKGKPDFGIAVTAGVLVGF